MALAICEQETINDALIQAMAVWQPGDLIKRKEGIVIGAKNEKKEWEPPSLDRIKSKFAEKS